MIVSNYSNKKLVEYLESGKKYLFVFQHGLGDTMMFYPVYELVCEMFPKCKIDLHVDYGQDVLFKSVPFVEANYDICFVINYPMAESTPFTKPEYCCLWEMGVQYSKVKKEIATIPKTDSPFVGVHFQGTSMDKVVSVPEGIANLIWDEIKEAGYIPVEIFFKHCFYNPANEKYGFIDNTCRNSKATLTNLIGAIQHCRCFIGVVSGPLLVACSIYPERVLCLERGFHISSFLKKTTMKSMDMNKSYSFGSVRNWMENLK